MSQNKKLKRKATSTIAEVALCAYALRFAHLCPKFALPASISRKRKGLPNLDWLCTFTGRGNIIQSHFFTRGSG